MSIVNFDGVLEPGVCELLIDMFETSTNKESFNNELRPKFEQITIADEHMHRYLTQMAVEILRRYREMTTEFMPVPKMLEQFRVKKYVGDTDDQFAGHIDSVAGESSSRYVAILIYLNDDFEEGETEFLFKNPVVFKPVQGSAVVFPPFWTHPHRGKPCKNGNKYILSTYARYE